MKTIKTSSSRGQSLVEWAFVLPIILLVTMMILDLGRAVYYYSAIYNSAREGARYAVIYPDDTAGISTRVKNMSVGLSDADLTVSTTLPTEKTVRVSVTYRFVAVTPLVSALLGSSDITLRSQTTMQVEK
ncbi:MAG: pilus assembly protein [Chloroflexota bacterium]|nr:MAG: pilus assembly protein [Chloroflexota bacterium]